MTDEIGLRLFLDTASSLAQKYQISSLTPLIGSARHSLNSQELTIAVTGRFKAGKSSLLNSLLGRDLLPVGVTPVTSVVTFLAYGPRERGYVKFLDGSDREIALSSIRAYVAESENPDNWKQVGAVTVELPALARYPGIRLADTPGLESVLAHNTEAALEWLPNVGIALVTISVDQPLSQQDVGLLRNLYQHTPEVAILLTKVDVVSEPERAEVEDFIHKQLEKQLGRTLPLYPISTRTGYEDLRKNIEQNVLGRTMVDFQLQRSNIVRTKVQTVLRECGDYLSLALKAAEIRDSDRDRLQDLVVTQRGLLQEIKTELRLIGKNATGSTRPFVEQMLQAHQTEIEYTLTAELKREFPAWSASLDRAASEFDNWLESALVRELGRVSSTHRKDFLEHSQRLKGHLDRSLQDFRSRLSAEVLRVLGMPLRTGDLEIPFESPKAPDVRVGKIFDHNWEIFSWLIPMRFVGRTVFRHFSRKIPDVVFKNISRLTSQWEELLSNAITTLERQAEGRAEQVIESVEAMISTTNEQVPAIKTDLRQLRSIGFGAGLHASGVTEATPS